MEINKKHPKKIQVLENTLGITLLLRNKDDVAENPNSYAINDKNYITHLNLSDNGLENICFLDIFMDLECLYLYENKLTNIEVLQSFSELKELRLGSNRLSNIETLKNLVNLEILYLPNNKIKNIKALENLTSLSKLVLSANKITNIYPLKNLKNLKELSLGANLLTDITVLENIANLEILFLRNNKISNIDVLKNLKTLRTLSLSYNRITDIEYVKKCVPMSLKHLHINNNPFIQPEGLSLINGEDHLYILKLKKKIFISYSRKDVEFKDELKKHLNILSQFDIVDNWSCEDITIGNWDNQIQKELNESSIIIYMLSANFFSSSYILEKEVQNVMNEKRDERSILCVIVSDFVDLDKIENYLQNWGISDKQKAILMLKKFQYLPYGREFNRITGQDEEKLVSLKRYSNNRDIETALKQISEKVLHVL